MTRCAAFIALLVVGCQIDPAYDPDCVMEYRHFPEYGGYLPLMREEQRAAKEGEPVRPESEDPWPVGLDRAWVGIAAVLPVERPDGTLDYSVPATAAEADSRLRREAEEGGHYEVRLGMRQNPTPAGFALTLAVAPLALALTPVILPVVMLTHDEDLGFADFAGVAVTVTVTDRKGLPIPGARVLEITSPARVFTYADAVGRRSFGSTEDVFYSVPEASAGPIAEAVGAYGGEIDGPFRKIRWWSGPRETGCDGEVSWSSKAFNAQARLADGEWAWALPPVPATLFIACSADGYIPRVDVVRGVQPLSSVSLTAILDRPRPGRKAAPGAMPALSMDATPAALAQGEALFPGLPSLDTLRAEIALGEGRRDEAVRLARYMDHRAYFGLFHGRSAIFRQR